MTNKQKIYFIIQKRKVVSLTDLYDIMAIDRMQILSAVSHLCISRKIRAVRQENVRYFVIKEKPLKNA
jgi:hypothetical protein